jgi:hypothetical protein
MRFIVPTLLALLIAMPLTAQPEPKPPALPTDE